MINASTMGIIFPNMHDQNVPELVNLRTMASIPFGGRYRMIDFCLSAMARAGIQNIGVMAQKNFQSLMDHLGSGREWDLSSKRGGLVLFPPYARGGIELYSGRFEALASVLDYMTSRRESLVVMSDCDTAYNPDMKDLVARHRESGADVTLVYAKRNITQGMCKDNTTLALDKAGRVTEIRVNEYKKGAQNLFLNMFVMGREHLINVVREAMVQGKKHFTLDFMAKSLKNLKICGYEFSGYTAHIYDMQSYFSENLRLAKQENLAALFPAGRPVYTKVRDEAPVRYGMGARVSGSLVADGCIVEGEVENSVLFRGVHVCKGSVVKNCVIMQGSQIEADVRMENVITDKNVRVVSGQRLRGAASFPVFISKGGVVT